MKGKAIIKYIAYTIMTFLLLDYIGAIISQFVTNIKKPYKVPIDFLPIDQMMGVMHSGRSMGILLLLTASTIALVLFRAYENRNMDERGFKYSGNGTYGTARWMSKEEISKIFLLKDPKHSEGIILGKTKENQTICLPKNAMTNKHIAVYGAPGTGKSRCFVRPMIFERMKAKESMIITDPKGELYGDTATMLEKAGYTVKILNLKSFDNSDSWNCLGEINGGKVDENASNFTDIVIRNTSEGDKFWDNNEINLLKALVLYVGHSMHWRGERNIGEVYKLLSKTSVERLDEMFEQVNISDPCKQPYNIFKQAGNLRPNIIIGLATRLQVFQNEIVCKATSINDIDLLLPGKEPCAYFVIMDDQSSTFDFLAALFFSFLFIKLVHYADTLPARRLPVDTYFIMDEFPNISEIPDFNAKLSTVRSRGISISIIFQALSQMQERYPKIWDAILGNCDTQIFLGANDQTTADYVSKRTGEVTIDVATQRTTKKTIRVTDYVPEYQLSKGDGRRRLLTMDEVMRLDRKECLVILNSQPVLKAKKFDFTEHPCSALVKEINHTDHVPMWREPVPIPMPHLDEAQASAAQPAVPPATVPQASDTHEEDFENLTVIQQEGKIMVVEKDTGEIRKDELAIKYLMSILEDGTEKPETTTPETESNEDINATLSYYFTKKQDQKDSRSSPVNKNQKEPQKETRPSFPQPSVDQARSAAPMEAAEEKEESVRAKKIGNLKFHKVEFEGEQVADDFIK